jgi:hypothetical protein
VLLLLLMSLLVWVLHQVVVLLLLHRLSGVCCDATLLRCAQRAPARARQQSEGLGVHP